MAPTEFYQLSLNEANMIMKGHQRALERDYNLMFIAMYNATGLIQGGKKFKPEHPFSDKNKTNKQPTKEERDETLSWLLS